MALTIRTYWGNDEAETLTFEVIDTSDGEVLGSFDNPEEATQLICMLDGEVLSEEFDAYFAEQPDPVSFVPTGDKAKPGDDDYVAPIIDDEVPF